MNIKRRWIYAVVGVTVLLFAGLVYAWSVLSVPIAAEFPAWTRAQLSLTFTLVMVFFCIGSLVCGFLAGKIKARASVMVAAALFIIGFYLASRAHTTGMLYVSFGVLCGLGSGLSYNAVMSTMVRWYPDRPGLISGILLMGFGGGSFAIGKLFQAWTPDTIGAWRTGFIVLGVITCVVLLICSFFFVAPPDGYMVATGKKNDICVVEDSKPARTLRSPAFWLYYVWAIVTSAAGLALISQASGIVREGDDAVAASAVATIVGIISLCNAGGRVLFGGMYDRFGRSLSMQLVNLLFVVTAGVLLLALSLHSLLLVIVGFVLGGLSYSGVTPTNSAFCRAYFGPKYYPVNFPLINSNLIIASFGSTVSGVLYDATESYQATAFLIIGLAVVGALCSFGITAFDARNKNN